MKEVFQKMKECLDRGEDVVFVTVAASSGSTPREAGAPSFTAFCTITTGVGQEYPLASIMIHPSS